MSILSIINEVAATPSKNDKVAILTSHKENSLLMRVLVAAYDPTINYWIKKIPSPMDSIIACDSLDTALDQLCAISSRKVTGGVAQQILSHILTNVSTDDAEIIHRIVLRDLRAGFSASTINKVWKGLIKETPYMRCSLPKELKGKNQLVNWPWEQGIPIQTKEDGAFCFINNYGPNQVTLNTRSGSIYDNSVIPYVFIMALESLIPVGEQTHGELLVTFEGKVLPRETGNGMLNSLLKGTELQQGYSLKYVVWDMIPIEVSIPGGKHHVPYHDRFAMVCQSFSGQSEFINVVDTEFVHSYAEAMSFYAACLAEGLEGSVLKHPQMIWEDTTSRGQVKLKLEFQCELEVIGKNEGTGKYKGMLGSLACKSSCGKLTVNVSGYSDKQRKEFWESDDIVSIGSIIQCHANNLSTDRRTGEYSLFLPIFEEVRMDKTEADSLERIITIYESAINPS